MHSDGYVSVFHCPECGLHDNDVTVWPVYCVCGNRYDHPGDAGSSACWLKPRTTHEIKRIEEEHCDHCEWFVGFCHAARRASCRSRRVQWKRAMRNPHFVCPDGKWGKLDGGPAVTRE